MTAVVPELSVASRILHRIQGGGRGRVFVPRDFLDLGTRAAVDVTLHRMVAAERIRRLGRGLYVYPKVHPRLGALTPPVDTVAQAIARSTGETLAQSGAAAANLLGLSTQVPARPVFLTSGDSRSVQVGNISLHFKHAAPSSMVGGDSRPGLVLRALRYLGPGGIDEGVLARLRSDLDGSDQRGLQALRPDAPGWLQPILDRILGASPERTGASSGARDRSLGDRSPRRAGSIASPR